MVRRKRSSERKFHRTLVAQRPINAHAQRVKSAIDLALEKGDVNITRERATEIKHLCCGLDPVGEVLCGRFPVDHDDIQLLAEVDKRFPKIIGLGSIKWRVNARTGLLVPFIGGDIFIHPKEIVDLWLCHIADDPIKFEQKVKDYYWDAVQKRNLAIFPIPRTLLGNIRWFMSKERKLLNKLRGELSPNEFKYLPTMVINHVIGGHQLTSSDIQKMTSGMVEIGYLKDSADAACYAITLEIALGLLNIGRWNLLGGFGQG